ncbi:MAG: DUF5610 domain-containing protein [Gallionellaceae bacterium]
MKVETANQGINTSIQPGKVNQAAATDKSGINASKQILNQQILSSSLEVSLSSGNKSMALLYRSAIENINQALEPTLGANAIQNASASGIDNSPQATADRIVSLSTAFFGKYQAKHPEKNLDTALQDFSKLIGGGINKGFSEARNILDGLSVLKGDIASNVDKTYELVQSGLKSFVDNYPRGDAAKSVNLSTQQ